MIELHFHCYPKKKLFVNPMQIAALLEGYNENYASILLTNATTPIAIKEPYAEVKQKIADFWSNL